MHNFLFHGSWDAQPPVLWRLGCTTPYFMEVGMHNFYFLELGCTAPHFMEVGMRNSYFMEVGMRNFLFYGGWAFAILALRVFIWGCHFETSQSSDPTS